MENIPTYGVRYVSDRRPHPTVTTPFASLDEAKAAFARLAADGRVGELKLIAPAHEVVEHYATKGRSVLALVKEQFGDGTYWAIELWGVAMSGFYSETHNLHKDKRTATRQIMSVFAGLCMAERAAAAAFAERKAA